MLSASYSVAGAIELGALLTCSCLASISVEGSLDGVSAIVEDERRTGFLSTSRGWSWVRKGWKVGSAEGRCKSEEEERWRRAGGFFLSFLAPGLTIFRDKCDHDPAAAALQIAMAGGRKERGSASRQG